MKGMLHRQFTAEFRGEARSNWCMQGLAERNSQAGDTDAGSIVEEVLPDYPRQTLFISPSFH